MGNVIALSEDWLKNRIRIFILKVLYKLPYKVVKVSIIMIHNLDKHINRKSLKGHGLGAGKWG